jgi:flagellar hook assembly protein FlgD
LEKNAQVALNVYDVTGKVVSTQNMGEQNSGTHSVNFNTEALTAGVYYYSLTVNSTATAAMKMVIIK